jgi:hypothetical protein
MPSGMPVFVRIDEYKDVLEVLDLLNKRVEKAHEIIDRLCQLKEEEETELDVWQKELDEVERKVSFMNRTLVEPNM